MKNKAAQQLNKLRNKSLSPKRRREIAVLANKASQLARAKIDRIEEVVA